MEKAELIFNLILRAGTYISLTTLIGLILFKVLPTESQTPALIVVAWLAHNLGLKSPFEESSLSKVKKLSQYEDSSSSTSSTE